MIFYTLIQKDYKRYLITFKGAKVPGNLVATIKFSMINMFPMQNFKKIEEVLVQS